MFHRLYFVEITTVLYFSFTPRALFAIICIAERRVLPVYCPIGAKNMKIQGTRGSITFDYENGYSLEAQGELCMDHTFWVNVQSIKFWNPPHEDERVTQQQLIQLITDVAEETRDSHMTVKFD